MGIGALVYTVRHRSFQVKNNDDGFFIACEDFGGRFDDTFSTCSLSLSLLGGDQLAHTNSTFSGGGVGVVVRCGVNRGLSMSSMSRIPLARFPLAQGFIHSNEFPRYLDSH